MSEVNYQINITQEILNNLSNGSHTFKITATDTDGNVVESTSTFVKKNEPVITADDDYGIQTTGFNVAFTVTDVDGDALTANAKLNGNTLYEGNPVSGQQVVFNVSPAVVESLASTDYTIIITASDSDGNEVTKNITFTKMAKPVITALAYIGHYSEPFEFNYMVSDVDSISVDVDIFIDGKGESQRIYHGQPELDVELTQEVDTDTISIGNHTIYIIANDGYVTAEKEIKFARESSPIESPVGLKVKYKDDAWDTVQFPNRIYQKDMVTYEDQELETFTDKTPYAQEGTDVNASLLMSVSHNITEFLSRTTTLEGNTITEETANGIKTTRLNADRSITEEWIDADNNVIKKDTILAEKTIVERAYR